MVRSPRVSELGFERAGTVQAILIDEGQIVEKGDILAQLDDRKLRAQQREVDARLKVNGRFW